MAKKASVDKSVCVACGVCQKACPKQAIEIIKGCYAKVNEENNIFEFVQLCEKVLVEKPLFVLLNSYTTGLGSTAMENVLKLALGRKGKYESYEVGLPTKEGIVLPCGNSAMYIGE